MSLTSSEVGMPALVACGAFLAALVAIFILHAARQASLLLVDLADCAIRLVTVEASHAVLASSEAVPA